MASQSQLLCSQSSYHLTIFAKHCIVVKVFIVLSPTSSVLELEYSVSSINIASLGQQFKVEVNSRQHSDIFCLLFVWLVHLLFLLVPDTCQSNSIYKVQ